MTILVFGGRYVGVETRTIDGISYILPVINAIQVDHKEISYIDDNKEEISLIRTVAKYLFGEDIKINSPENGSSALVTLDNQSNANFKAFDFYGNGLITYNKEYSNLSDSVVKKLWVSTDFKHFIVTTYDSNLKYVYIEYFDNEFNKLWSREFQYESKEVENVSPIDYNDKQLAVVIDNDLYLIDLETGKNLIEPALVGFKTKVMIMEDGIILIGKENKDLVIKLDFSGNIMYRINGDSNLTRIESVQTQIVNNKILLFVYGINENALDADNPDEIEIMKYMIINNDGTIEYSTRDLSGYMG